MQCNPAIAQLAPNALTTLCDMKTMLGISPGDIDPARDAMIINMINAVSSWVQRMTGRNLGKQHYVQRYFAEGRQELVLLQWPIVKVDSVKDVSGGTFISPEDYSILDTSDIGVIYNDGGWPLRGFRGGLAFDIIAQRRVLEVSYTAGYVLPKDATEDDPATLPADILSVVWSSVMQEFALLMNGAQGLSAFSISDVSWSFDKAPQQSWLDTIGRYVRM